jgi:anti-sigma regulatory factor (Ser/Thr protein kinase)
MSREYRFSPTPASIAEARALVRQSLAGRADAARLAEVELVVSELVTNSVRHGPGKPIALRLEIQRNGTIHGEVADQGDAVVAIRRHDVASTVGGLGLPIVDRLTSAWGVYPGSTHVWFRFDATS